MRTSPAFPGTSPGDECWHSPLLQGDTRFQISCRGAPLDSLPPFSVRSHRGLRRTLPRLLAVATSIEERRRSRGCPPPTSQGHGLGGRQCALTLKCHDCDVLHIGAGTARLWPGPCCHAHRHLRTFATLEGPLIGAVVLVATSIPASHVAGSTGAGEEYAGCWRCGSGAAVLTSFGFELLGGWSRSERCRGAQQRTRQAAPNTLSCLAVAVPRWYLASLGWSHTL